VGCAEGAAAVGAAVRQGASWTSSICSGRGGWRWALGP
jgi:hypothetical protein